MCYYKLVSVLILKRANYLYPDGLYVNEMLMVASFIKEGGALKQSSSDVGIEDYCLATPAGPNRGMPVLVTDRLACK